MCSAEFTMLVHHMHIQAQVMRVKMMAASITHRHCIHASRRRTLWPERTCAVAHMLCSTYYAWTSSSNRARRFMHLIAQ
jgi:hypothetical protein